MKRSAVLISIFILIGSCSKTDTISNEIRKCDCSFYLPPQEEVNDPVNLCQNDTCQNYFKIWKELFLERNQMTEDYFNIHIIPFNTSLQHWNDGISFRIQYRVKIDWMEVKMNENFIIWLSPSTEGLYASLNIPRSTLLSKDLVKRTIDNYAFNSLKFDVSPINNLKYKSRTEAKKALIKASAVDTLCAERIFFQQSKPITTYNGHPIFESTGVLNWGENKCISGQIDLVTGENKVSYNECYILFCFQKGTKITMHNQISKSIEKIKTGDTILSVNLKTMKFESDIVQKVDSVVHQDMIKIVFDDLTENNNTSDHPYYVANKGWSSYKPQETMKKYNVMTKQLRAGDECLKRVNDKLVKVRIKSIREDFGEVKTYNLTRLQKNNNFLANGILVSNENAK